MPRYGPYAGIAVAVVGVSFASIFIRWSDAPPLAIAAYRMGIVSLILLPFALTYSREEIRSTSRRQTLLLVAVGAVLAAHFFTFITSVKLTSVASATILVTCHPFIVIIISHFWLKESSRFAVPGVFLGFLGVVVISYGNWGGTRFEGDVLALLGAVLAAVYILTGRFFRRKIGLITYVFTVYASAAVVLFATCLIGNVPLWPYPTQEFVLFAALAIVSTIFGHTLFNWSLRYLPAYVISVSLLAEPIGATVLAVLLLSEIPSSIVLVGGAMVLVGVIITACVRQRPSDGVCDTS
jgi:drug/metabolite transporter (DMT)-like permease